MAVCSFIIWREGGLHSVIHFDPWWNPAVEDQATDRAHRIGQKNTVYSVKLITRNTVEEKVLQMQQKKKAVIDATLEKDGAFEQGLSWNDVQELLSIWKICRDFDEGNKAGGLFMMPKITFVLEC